MTTPTPEEIEDERDKASTLIADGEDPWPGMTYLQGVQDGLSWALGEMDERPLQELDE